MTKIDPLLDCLRITSVHSESFLFTLVEAAVLVAEVERLRGEAERERAAIVRWLRDEAARLRKAEFVGSRAYVLESTAYMIENGVHADQKEKA